MRIKKTVHDLLNNPNKKMNSVELAALSAYFRKEMFEILHQRGTGHWGGASSAAELVTSLYFNRMKIDPNNPAWQDRDRFVLSKGHASINIYTVLAHRGFFSPSILSTFRTLGSILQGHPCMRKVPGIDISTGVLGHGLSIGLGMALAASLNKKDYCTYVLMGEGCLDEGQTWEAMMMASKHKVRNLVLMIDYNKYQLDGRVDEIMPLEPLRDKLASFGWNVCPLKLDGNNTVNVLKSFDWIDQEEPWPKAIVYDTIKGKGVDFTENTNKWHGAVITDEAFEKGYPQLCADLEKKEAAL